MAKVSLRPGDALLIIHVQRDFLPDGALAVAHGGDVVGPLNAYGKAFASAGLPVFATRDWHPPNHCSFTAQGGPWPPHCVAGSPGARFASALDLPPGVIVIDQATNPDREAYSSFSGTALNEELKRRRVGRLFVGGLATEYCVLHTVLDALALGYAVVLLTDAVRALDARTGEGQKALDAMRSAGAEVRTLDFDRE